MPVFSRHSLHQLPLTGIALCVLLVSFSLAANLVDQHQSPSLLQRYQNSNIATLEASLYLAYHERQLHITEQGSAETLKVIDQALQKKPPPDVLWAIANDRNFYHYIYSEGPLFLEKQTYQNWLLERQQNIQPAFARLSMHRFGLSPEAASPSTLLSYALLDNEYLRLGLNILLILLLAPVIEKIYSAARLVQFFILASGLSGLTYTLLANQQNPIMLGASGGSIGLVALGLVALLYQDEQEPLRPRLEGSVLTVLCLILLCLGKVLLESWYGSTDSTMMTAYAISALICIPLAIIFRYFAAKQQQAQQREHQALEDWEQKDALAQAYDALSCFEFEKAKQLFSGLHAQTPKDLRILKQSYLLEKLNPQTDSYRDALQRLLDVCTEQDELELSKMLLADIKHFWPTRQAIASKLAPESYLKLLILFLRHDQLRLAEQAFHYLEQAGSTAIVQDACTLMLDEFKKHNKPAKSQEYAMLLETL